MKKTVLYSRYRSGTGTGAGTGSGSGTGRSSSRQGAPAAQVLHFGEHISRGDGRLCARSNLDAAELAVLLVRRSRSRTGTSVGPT